jgi:hypothetical protein
MVPAVRSLEVEAARFMLLDFFAAIPTLPTLSLPPSPLLASVAVADTIANNVTTLRRRYYIFWHSSHVTEADLRGLAALRRLQSL